jgi:hypothetical protein
MERRERNKEDNERKEAGGMERRERNKEDNDRKEAGGMEMREETMGIMKERKMVGWKGGKEIERR